MKILLIGNGFDLAHDLPTRYKDFLDFCCRIEKIFTYNNSVRLKEYQQKCLDDWNINEKIKELLLEIYDGRVSHKKMLDDASIETVVTTSNGTVNELHNLIKDNMWIKYFQEILSDASIGENWIDFESEISRIIQAFDEIRVGVERPKAKEDVRPQIMSCISKFLKAAGKKLTDLMKGIENFDKFVVHMELELEQLIRALEIYFIDFVKEIKVIKKIPEIDHLDAVDHVLSFNYTDTYNRIYGNNKNIEYNYIHGKAEHYNTLESNNMVLGIDEYLCEDRKDKEFTFLAFKKFYQRLLKATDRQYLDWIDEIRDGYEMYKKNYEKAMASMEVSDGRDPFTKEIGFAEPNIARPEHTLYIFGHSLDATDKDVLKSIICNDNVQTKIYYYRKTEYDNAELGKLIKNLTRIMGQDELIRRTGGNHKTIEFIPQTINNS